jgi:hypothetical protein
VGIDRSRWAKALLHRVRAVSWAGFENQCLCCARRSHRPTHPGGIFAAPCASIRLSPSTRERLPPTLDYPDSLIHQYRIPAPAADRCRGAPALPSWCPLAPASVAAQTAPGSCETRAWRTWRTLSPRTHAPAHTASSPPVPPPKLPTYTFYSRSVRQVRQEQLSVVLPPVLGVRGGVGAGSG